MSHIRPEFDLEPGLGDEFVFKQMKMVSIRFLMDNRGKVTGLEMNQGGAVFEAHRRIDDAINWKGVK